MRTLKPFIIFDRDGTIIEDKIYLSRTEDLRYLGGVIEALKKLRDFGFRFVVATNQSGMASGKVSIDQINAIHRKMDEDLARHGLHIEGYYYAHYAVETNHPLRKPNPGMLEEAIRDFGIDVSKSYMIGDRVTDVQAGKKVGLKTVLLSQDGMNSEADFVFNSLFDFVFNTHFN